tara:strand:+ start:484 stop:696 length:213 start_codon:yes stop_codon:yes gene_type:complete
MKTDNSKGRNGFKRRSSKGNYSPEKKDSEELAIGRDICKAHREYGKDSLSINDVDNIPGIENFIKIKEKE